MKFRTVYLVPICLAELLLIYALFSLHGRPHTDSPLMLYLAFVMDRYQYVPYRDFFDMNMAGIYFINYVFGRVTNYTDIGLRILDLLYLAAIMGVTWMWLSKIGKLVSWCAVLSFGLLYLSLGMRLSLQREYLLLLPLSIAVLIATSSTTSKNKRALLSSLVIGFLCGLAGTIKPQAAIGLPVLVIYQVWTSTTENTTSSRRWRQTILRFISCSVGFVLPFALIGTYLWQNHALSSFIDMVIHYWPLYASLTGAGDVDPGLNGVYYLLKNYFMFDNAIWLAAAGLGSYVALFNSTLTGSKRREVVLVVALAFTYSLYAVIGGKFWDYQWLPFNYFVLILASLCFVQLSGNISMIQALFPVALFLVTVACQVAIPVETDGSSQNIDFSPAQVPLQVRRADEIAAFLEQHTTTDDTVQPLDSVGGAVHAMLIARVRLATPFIYDFHFYHNISDPYIQQLRVRFMEAMRQAHPKFIIEIVHPKPTGPDTTTQFVELKEFMATHYQKAVTGKDYTIYERISSQY